MICGALPSDCAPVECVNRQGCNIVGNDPCVVPLRLPVTLPRTDSIPRYALSAMSHPTKCRWHYVRTLPINALKVLGESRGASFKKPLWRIPRIPRVPSHPLPLFDGEAERAETATESEIVAVRVGKEVGALQTELAVAVE